MDELLTMSVVEMAARIRKGELSPKTALEAHLARIEAVNPKLNAVIEPRFEQARQEAQAAEDRLAQGRDGLPPLLGVPCTIKDTYAVKGLPWSGGVWARRNFIADFDATVVERVRAAGAIVMGKTNVPEAAMFCETYNHVYGRTNNPYDLSRGVGGSSGGEGAIVAAAASPFGIGSDIGGSIRYPSAFNGTVGHKPSGGLVSAYGHFPPAEGPLAPYCCYGPIGRRVDDLACVLSLIAGPDGHDPIVPERRIPPLDRVDLDELKVFYYDDNGVIPAGDEVKRAVALAAGALRSEVRSIEYWRPAGIEQSLNIWIAAMSQLPHSFRDYLRLENDPPIRPFRELLKLIARTSKITFPALGTCLTEYAKPILAGRNQQVLALADDLRHRLTQTLGDNGVIVCPVFPTPAPKHTAIWLNLHGISYSGLFNVMHFPSTIVPIYHRPDGLPISIQIVAARFNDHLTLAVARRLEKIFGGWKPKEVIA
jgi:fatty acid amide hydrolase 2